MYDRYSYIIFLPLFFRVIADNIIMKKGDGDEDENAYADDFDDEDEYVEDFCDEEEKNNARTGEDKKTKKKTSVRPKSSKSERNRSGTNEDQKMAQLIAKKKRVQERAKSRMRVLHDEYDRRTIQKIHKYERLKAKLTKGSPYVDKNEARENRGHIKVDTKTRQAQKDKIDKEIENALHDASLVLERLNEARMRLKRVSADDLVVLTKTPVPASSEDRRFHVAFSMYRHVLRTACFLLHGVGESFEKKTCKSDDAFSFSFKKCCEELQRAQAIDRLVDIKPSTMRSDMREVLSWSHNERLDGLSPGRKVSFRSIAQSRMSPRLIRVISKWIGFLQEAVIMTSVLRALQESCEALHRRRSPLKKSGRSYKEIRASRATRLPSPDTSHGEMRKRNIWQWRRRVARRQCMGRNDAEASEEQVRGLKKRLRKELLSRPSKLLAHIDEAPPEASISFEEFRSALAHCEGPAVSPSLARRVYRSIEAKTEETDGNNKGVTWGAFQCSVFPEISGVS